MALSNFGNILTSSNHHLSHPKHYLILTKLNTVSISSSPTCSKQLISSNRSITPGQYHVLERRTARCPTRAASPHSSIFLRWDLTGQFPVITPVAKRMRFFLWCSNLFVLLISIFGHWFRSLLQSSRSWQISFSFFLMILSIAL